MRASLEFLLHLLILKLLFPSIYIYIHTCIYFQVSNYIYNQCSFLSLLMVWHYNINDSMSTKLTLRNLCICERAVGTSETLSLHMTYLSAYIYRQISKCTDKTPKKQYWGGGGGAMAPAPPPPLLWLR